MSAAVWFETDMKQAFIAQDCITNIFCDSKKQTRHIASTLFSDCWHFATQRTSVATSRELSLRAATGWCRSKEAWEHFIFVPLPQSRVKTSHLDCGKSDIMVIRHFWTISKRVWNPNPPIQRLCVKIEYLQVLWFKTSISLFK